MPCFRVRHANRKPDVEALDRLDFNDPSWMIDNHRRNLIKKISRPESSWFEALTTRITRADNNHKHNVLERGEDNREHASDNRQLELNNNQPANTPRSEQSYRISFSELQRLRLRQLQHKLVQHVVDLRYNAREPSSWAVDLREYGKSGISHYQLSPLCLLHRLTA
jgi:hypothetical protein